MKTPAKILFLKVPEKGQVKTRLGRHLDEGLVLELYKAFVQDMLSLLQPENRCFVFFTPPEKKELLVRWLGKKYRYQEQTGDDIGQRMAHAFESVFCKGFETAVLIGADIPEIDETILNRAARALEKKDAVIGPSRDGGYYLMGLNQKAFSPSLFRKIKWSTPEVLARTIHILKNLSISYQLIDRLNDIDTVRDLKALTKQVADGKKIGTHTLKVIRDHGL